MYSRDIEKIKPNIREDGVAMFNLFGGLVKAGEKVSMGYAVFPPGTDVPIASHKEDEYSYILEGSVKCEIGGIISEMNEGMASFIPAGEEHRSFNDSHKECKLVWILIEK